MNILNFFIANWDSILIALVIIDAVIILIAKKQFAILDRIVFALVAEAEKQYGGGTGALKLAAVIDWVYPKIPTIIRLFITEQQLTSLIEKVLKEAQAKWDNNPNLSTYIGKAAE